MTPSPGDRQSLCEFALAALPSLRTRSGLYCYDRAWGHNGVRGESVRYSLMVWLGLERAASAGFDPGDDLDALYARCEHHPDLAPGDLGLLLWCDARRGGKSLPELLDRVAPLTGDGVLDPLAGMEIGWLLLGLAHATGTLGDERARTLLERVLAHLYGRRSSRSALFSHVGSGHPRRRFPNFATQVYSLMALTTIAAYGLDDSARQRAVALADTLCGLQRPDGGWPWLFHADAAHVVEPYDVYSVHQDGMAPMALLPLAELTGDTRYRAAALHGLAWCFGANELGVDFYNRDGHFAHRSIKRAGSRARLALLANTAAASVLGRGVIADTNHLELNRTCRPYHLGWILEAWAGRLEARP